ncbi:TPA: phage tail protein [Acinetobacter baumannii]
MANLVFKFSWDHRPFPYNSAQGKRQFMLPFASGIPNLNPRWDQIQGGGNAATGTLTTSPTDMTPGRVLRVGDYGYGTFSTPGGYTPALDMSRNGGIFTILNGVYAGLAISTNSTDGIIFAGSPTTTAYGQFIGVVRSSTLPNTTHIFKTDRNTTVDGNGFIKAASPIVKLFSDHIELNDEAERQPITLEKLGTGDYLIKGSLGFAKEGWYIEIPKDANGNTVVAVVYGTLENGDISIKTFKRKFDIETAAIIADLSNPLEIPEGRWIDIRLFEEPIVVSAAPMEFQPTNLSEAVAAAMAGVEPPEISDTDETL